MTKEHKPGTGAIVLDSSNGTQFAGNVTIKDGVITVNEDAVSRAAGGYEEVDLPAGSKVVPGTTAGTIALVGGEEFELHEPLVMWR